MGDIKLDFYEDDGAFIFMHFSTEIECDNCDEAIQISEQITNEIEGAAELRIGVEMFSVSEADNEKEFTLRAVSYTHLTLPTILLVQISVVAVSLKKKNN
eukprot:TRINITY_DN58805_c0_g1_i1.p1 TRINITY_DN58805_c0_g1~~TRINITY_DN58805_c0_g1_i1.p1  ORF type:complete len:100 (+),score=31.40 TRINITY_DN58805_c0_g1_i1:187-486(+)